VVLAPSEGRDLAPRGRIGAASKKGARKELARTLLRLSLYADPSSWKMLQIIVNKVHENAPSEGPNASCEQVRGTGPLRPSTNKGNKVELGELIVKTQHYLYVSTTQSSTLLINIENLYSLYINNENNAALFC
jgi:hypothetical protein